MTDVKEIVTTRYYTISDIRTELRLTKDAKLQFNFPGRNSETRGGSFTSPDNFEVLKVEIREPYNEGRKNAI
jgi:hypothetical protein